jgi:uncharacterized phage protein (TIGR01671 family)
MREILFKAKQIDNGEWIEGSLIDLDIDSGYCYIVQPYKKASILPIIFLITDRMKLVDPETLCQFTGLCDKNGKKIWENDIVLVIYENRYYEKKELSTGRIVFIRGAWYIGGKVWNELYAIDEDAIFQVEIVGNIFDNPELLQEESDE